jgi:hypothetical protein
MGVGRQLTPEIAEHRDAYESGALSLADFATLTGLSQADLLHCLDAMGIARPLRVIQAVNVESLNRTLEQARRALSSGIESPRPAPAIESVVATQRLEGMDVREWARRQS